MICIWSSWCHCHPIISCLIKMQNGLPFCCRLTQVVLEKRLLNGCKVVVVWGVVQTKPKVPVITYQPCNMNSMMPNVGANMFSGRQHFGMPPMNMMHRPHRSVRCTRSNDMQSSHCGISVLMVAVNQVKVTPYSSLQHTSLLQKLTCHMGSRSVTCHPAAVTYSPLPQLIKATAWFSNPSGMQGWDFQYWDFATEIYTQAGNNLKTFSRLYM